MGKKTKNPEKNSADKAETSVNGSEAPNIFSKLFGGTSENGTSNSLFSNQNPFRRKHNDTQSQQDIGSASVEAKQAANVLDSEKPSDSVSNKGKRKKDESSNKDGDSEATEGKKSKKKQEIAVENPNAKLEEVGREQTGKKEKYEKKRKRDEIEREYEARLYGAPPQDEREKKEQKKDEKLAGKKRKSVENPAEMMVSDEGYDNEEKLLRTIFVGNLPLKVKKKVLLKEFSQFGEIETVRIRSIPTHDSKKPKKILVMQNEVNEAVGSCNAFIVFKTEQSAAASLAHNMAVVAEHHVRVDRACPPRKKLKGETAVLYDNKRTVFVGNLPFDVKDEEIYQLFRGINQLQGNLEAIRVVRDPNTSVGKGIAYVLFKTKEAANFVCKKKIKLRERELRISHAKSNPATKSNPTTKSNQTTPSKRKHSSVDHPEKSPAKKFAAGSSTSESGKVKIKVNTSYQGFRASKSGNKNVSSSTVQLKSPNQSGGMVKQRKGKRPAVAARRAKATGSTSGPPPMQAGKKRKMDSRTPSSFNRKDKAKKFK